MTREEIFEYTHDFFGTEPDYPWDSDPEYAVLRHRENKKWYGLVMKIPKTRLGLDSSEPADILNVKCDPVLIGSLILKKGYFRAYHMSKEHWITILLEEVPTDEVISLLNMSYDMTK